MNKLTSLHGNKLYIIQDKHNAYLSCIKTKPVNIISFISKRDANLISKDLNKSVSFSVLPTLMNAYVINTDLPTAHDNTTQQTIISQELLQTNVVEMTSSYLSLTKNLNRLNVIVIKDIEKTRTGSIMLYCDDEGLPYIYTDLQMMLGNLERIFVNSIS